MCKKNCVQTPWIQLSFCTPQVVVSSSFEAHQRGLWKCTNPWGRRLPKKKKGWSRHTEVSKFSNPQRKGKVQERLHHARQNTTQTGLSKGQSMAFQWCCLEKIPAMLFDLVMTRFEHNYNPHIIYDASCIAKEFGYNRELRRFMQLSITSDRFHEVNHKSCSNSFKTSEYNQLEKSTARHVNRLTLP